MKRIFITSTILAALGGFALAQAKPATFGQIIGKINAMVEKSEGIDPIAKADLIIELEEAFIVRVDQLEERKNKAIDALNGLEETPPEGQENPRDAFVDKLMGEAK